MTIHIRPEGAGSPLDLTTRITLGMPHLCPNGLSENWLWKELGHRHWDLIGRGIGRAAAGFGRAEAQPTYAAFRRIALQGGDFGLVGENDVVDLSSTLTHLSETRVVSHHIVAHQDRLVAEADMTSVFVRRQTQGVNRSIVRVRIDGPRSLSSSSGRSSVAAEGSTDSSVAAAGEDEQELGVLTIEPCPHLDFNGAGLLYFSSFIAAVDRAEWSLIGKGERLYATRDRQAVFHSNIDIGDDLCVRLLATKTGPTRHHRAEISAASDGRLLAEIITRRT